MKIRSFTMQYNQRNNWMASLHLFPTLAIYVTSLASGLYFYNNLVAFSISIICGALMAIRLFSLQHDCGHNAFFTKRIYNDIAGTVLGAIVLTPFKAMKYTHNVHHAHNGSLDLQDHHEIYTMTRTQYDDSAPSKQMIYRIYRSPLVLFVIGPLYFFFIRTRFPKNGLRTGIADVILSNFLTFAILAALYLAGGFSGVLVFAYCAALSSCMGIYLIYLQHNFETTYWERNPDLDFETAALQGSSVLDFGATFDLLMCNLTYHDLHHLNSKIPSYNLRKCHRALADRIQPTRITFLQSFRCISMKIWDEDLGCMTRFPEARTIERKLCVDQNLQA